MFCVGLCNLGDGAGLRVRVLLGGEGVDFKNLSQNNFGEVAVVI